MCLLQALNWKHDRAPIKRRPERSLYCCLSSQSAKSNARHLFLKAQKREQLIKLIYRINSSISFRVLYLLFLRYGVAVVRSDTYSSYPSNAVVSDFKSQQSVRLKDIITHQGTKPEKLPNNGDSKLFLSSLVTAPNLSGNQPISSIITFL